MSTLGRSMGLLTKIEKRKISGVIAIQIFLGFLDLVAIAIVGILGALAVNGVKSSEPDSRVSLILQLVGIDKLDFRTQVAILGIGAALILIVRTIFSVYFSRKILYFLSFKASTLTGRLFSRVIQKPLLSIRAKSSQELLFALTTGVTTVTMGVLGTASILISDLSLLIIIAIGLFVIDPILASSTLLIFGAISWFLFRLLNTRAQFLGEKNASLQVKGNSKILEIFASYREVIVSHRRVNYSIEVSKIRNQLAETIAELSFMPNISKYVMESAVVFGALLVAAVQFILKDAVNAVATLSVFLAAGARIAPAVMRIQQGAVSIKGSIGAATPTLNLIDELQEISDYSQREQELVVNHDGFVPRISINNVSLIYPGNPEPSLENILIDINPGSFVALVGPSGAGKTSIVDVLLGVLPPSSGNVKISAVSPPECFALWPGAISYLPQDVEIVNGTIRENICLGLDPKKVPDDLIWNAIEAAQLRSLVENLPFGVDAQIGEKGMKISGGQRQRLGIARALLSKPKLIVLDEATSALDGETEFKVTESLLKLRGDATIVMIAHRLSTIREADVIYYVVDGRIVASGNFQELKKKQPHFAEQAELMGL